MDSKSARSTVSVLRTVLHLLDDDPAIPRDSTAVHEFRRVATRLMAEIQSENDFTDELIRPKPDGAAPDGDGAFKP